MSEQDVELDIKTGEVLESTEDLQDDREDQDTPGSDAHDDDHDEEQEDSEASAHGDEHDDERDAIRERRRQERKQRRAAQKEREETLRRELAARDAVINQLRGEVDVIKRRNTGSELAQLNQAKEQTAQAYAYFKDQIRVATEAQNGAVVAEATEKMLLAKQRFEELDRIEKAYSTRSAQPQPLDPRLVNHAKSWMENNRWYKPESRDVDSRIVLTLDQALADEGFDPTTPEYWSELTERVKKHLPHRAAGGKITSSANKPPRPAVPAAQRDGGSSGSADGSFRLSAERVQALKEAGVWDNPTERAKAIKYFRDFDKANKGV